MLAQRLKDERIGWGYSQKELSEKSGVSLYKIRMIESGQWIPSVVEMRKISELTKRPVLWFFNDTDADCLNLLAPK